MATTYAGIQAQISKLQAQAAGLRTKEASKVIARIKADIATFGLSAADLGLVGGKPAKAGKLGKTAGVKAAKPASVAKYQDPESGRTWTGHGKQPQWIVGKNRDDFLIGAKPAATTEVAAVSETPADEAAAPKVSRARAVAASKPTKAKPKAVSSVKKAVKAAAKPVKAVSAKAAPAKTRKPRAKAEAA